MRIVWPCNSFLVLFCVFSVALLDGEGGDAVWGWKLPRQSLLLFLLHALSYPACFIRVRRKSDQMKSYFECLVPGLIPCAMSLCETSQVPLTVASLSGEIILLYFHLRLCPRLSLRLARSQNDAKMHRLHHNRNNNRRQRFEMNVVLMKSSFTVSLQLCFFFLKNKFTVIGVSQHEYIADKSCQTNLITYANEITISLDSINLSGCPEGFKKILHDGL